jgi:signal transduction histidine kinase
VNPSHPEAGPWTPATARRLSRSSWVVAVAAALGALVFVAIVDPEQIVTAVFMLLAAVAYASVGTLIASRHPSNPIGWLFVAVGACFGLTSLAAHYVGVSDRPLAFAAPIGLMSVVLPALVLPFALPTFLLLYPEGALLSRRWRPVVAAAGLAGIVLTLGLFESPSTARLVDTPNWVERIPGIAGFVTVGSALIAAVSVAGFASLVIRYRRAGPDQRPHVNFLVKLLAAMVALSALGITASAVVGDTEPAWILMFFALLVDGFGILIGIPVVTAIAVLTFGLYDVGIVMKKTIVYGLLVAGMGLFVALILLAFFPLAQGGAGEGGLAGRIVSGVLFALLAFAALWGRMKRIARRAVYGRRATPYEVIGEFAERLGEAYSTDDVLPRTADILRASTGADTARVWLRVGDELRPAAVSPSGAPPARAMRLSDDGVLPPLPGRSFPVRHQGDLLGAFTVEMPVSEPLSATSERLTADLATQAGLVLRNVRLTEELKATIEELRASRQRIVTAQDARARKLERDIHDGAQQQLVALTVKVGLTEQLLARDPEKARAILAELKTDATDALGTLRDLARGIYPPLLADKGLLTALESQAQRAPVATTVEAEDIGRFSPEIEAAVYFCALEALQNVAKYANAQGAFIRLAAPNGHLTFQVRDDGVGFDPDSAGRGTGLQGMADRVAALGGSLEIRSVIGDGTTVFGRIPIEVSK